MIVAILGRETRLAIAEIESITGPTALSHFGPHAALIDADTAPLLAGSPKVGTVLEQMPAAPWKLQQQNLKMSVLNYIRSLPLGKVTIGMSVYGAELSNKNIQSFLIDIKKQMKNEGRSVRVVPNKDPILNAASLINNKLTNQRGIDLLYVQFGNKAIVGRTTRVQNIDAFAQRDREKPVRDTKVGMLPPKLAKLMLSLATHSPQYQSGWILDPFCGTGTVLMEAAVGGCRAYGTDVAEEMVDAAQRNTAWLTQQGINHGEIAIERGDVTKHEWTLQKPLSAVVAEGYLGPPMKKPPSSAELSKIKSDVNALTKKALKNLHAQLPQGAPVILAIPAWHKNKEVTRLPLVDELEKLGYTRRDFEHIRGPLMYHREKQVVGREILVLERK